MGGRTLTVNNAGSGSTSGEDALIFGTTTLTGNAIFDVHSTVINVDTVIRLGALNGAFNITKTGNGVMQLNTAAGTYSGTTAVNGGTLIVGNNTALGSGAATVSGTAASVLRINNGVTVGNAIRFSSTNAGSSVQRLIVGSGTNYNIGTTGGFRSDFADGVDTFASFRNGAVTSGTTTATMSFSTTADATNESDRISDVFSLATSQTDTFVLQLSTQRIETGDIYLGWLDGDEWVEATLGNTGAGSLAGLHEGTWEAFLLANGAYNATTMLGAYGFDRNTGTVWAVLNHTGDMAVVVPEPSTYMLFGAAAGVLLLRFRVRWRLRKR